MVERKGIPTLEPCLLSLMQTRLGLLHESPFVLTTTRVALLWQRVHLISQISRSADATIQRAKCSGLRRSVPFTRESESLGYVCLKRQQRNIFSDPPALTILTIDEPPSQVRPRGSLVLTPRSSPTRSDTLRHRSQHGRPKDETSKHPLDSILFH